MHQYTSHIRQQVWSKMNQIFYQYTDGQPTINTSQLQRVIREILKEDSPRELDYVLNNLCKIDVDSNGSIDFPQFTNFLLKRHCGQLALQKMHYNNKMSQGKNRKITQGEFLMLLNLAYSFLKISISEESGNSLFRSIDGDGDGMITYVEYFGFVDQYLCKYETQRVVKAVGGTVSQVNSRFRNFIWEEMRKIYEHYDKDKSHSLDATEIQAIMRDFLKDISMEDFDYILFKVLRISANGSVLFPEFASFFLKYMTEVHLSRFYRLHGNQKHKLNRQDFLVLIKSTFNFLPISRVSVTLLYKIFYKIDSDNDGWISTKQMISWVELFLCPMMYSGREYYVQEDDENLTIGRGSILPLDVGNHNTISKSTVGIAQVTSHLMPVSSKVIPSLQPFSRGVGSVLKFSSQDLAIKVRKQYDQNNNKLFEQDEIVHMLVGIMKQSKNQIKYVISNVFRYDKDGDKKITYDQIADFLLQMHSGEMAIQRLHRNQTYKRGSQRIMDLTEFVLTINYALSFFDISTDQSTLRLLFIEIDRNGDGWITYQQYFQFLRYYFGSQSEVASSGIDKYQQAFAREANLIMSQNGYSFDEKIKRLFRLQMEFHVFKYDINHNRLLERQQITLLLTSVFGYRQPTLSTLLPTLFANNTTSIAFQNMFSWITTIHLTYSIANFLSRSHLRRKSEQLINFEEFVKLVELSFGFTSVTLKRDQLQAKFSEIDKDGDGWVGFGEWREWTSGMFGRVEKEKDRERGGISGAESEEQMLYSQIWRELKNLYNNYDNSRNNSLNKQGLELFCKQILLESTQKQLNYVSNSLQNSSQPSPSTIPFDKFAPFILNYAIENSLKKFHLQKTPGKQHLSREQFVQVVRSAYSFLKTKIDILLKIFGKLDRDSDGQVSYMELMSWVHFDVAKKSR